MQNGKTEGVNDEQNVKMICENLQNGNKATKKLIRRRNKIISHQQNNNKENALRSYSV